jgi:hypothetical protein
MAQKYFVSRSIVNENIATPSWMAELDKKRPKEKMNRARKRERNGAGEARGGVGVGNKPQIIVL